MLVQIQIVKNHQHRATPDAHANTLSALMMVTGESFFFLKVHFHPFG